MHQELAENVLALLDMPRGSRGLATLPESELLQPPVDLSLLRGSLECSPLRHASGSRGPKEDHSESGLALV